MIDDKLNNYNDKYKYKFDGNYCQYETFKSYGYQNLWYIANQLLDLGNGRCKRSCGIRY